MNQRAIFAIVRKDVKVTSQNKGVLVPIIIFTVVLFVLLPWVTRLIPVFESSLGDMLSGIEKSLTRMPAGLQQELTGLNRTQILIVYFLKYSLTPMFLMVPLMVALTIAADSFAGEKERKTMEALLYTPTTDRELLVAKLISGWVAAITVAWVGFVLYAVMANVAAWPQMQQIFFPNLMWVVLIFWVVPPIAGVGVGTMVLASSRAQGFQDANQIGGIVMLPIIALFYLQVAGAMVFNVAIVFLVGLVAWILTGLLIWLGSRIFQRKRILAA